jgi:hypothetical protein
MASGKFWAGLLTANNSTDTGVVPAAKIRTVNINVANYGSVDVLIRVYIGMNAAPSDADRIEADITLKPGQLYKLTGEPMSTGERVILFSNNTGAVARVSGFEEAA